MTYLLALDQGTSSSRSIVFGRDGRIVTMAQREFRQIYPQPGWVEHDPRDLWTTQLETARQALQQAGLRATDIAAVGITNQRETTVVWNRKTGQPIHPAIVWQDRRAEPTCADLRAWSVADLTREFGSFGASLHHLCRGIDERPVQPDRVRKSLSVETTYTPDLHDLDACRAGLRALLEDFHRRFERARDRPPVHKAFVKVRFADFSRTTAECVSSAPDDALWLRLLAEARGRKALPVRLLGVGVRFAEDVGEAAPAQIPLFDSAPAASTTDATD